MRRDTGHGGFEPAERFGQLPPADDGRVPQPAVERLPAPTQGIHADPAGRRVEGRAPPLAECEVVAGLEKPRAIVERVLACRDEIPPRRRA
jgi:hypothetical protein